MQVVLFCGGLGMRLRDDAPHVPKPIVPIGDAPILDHLMRYYAHHGHRRFVLCLGHRGELIVDHFLRAPDRVGAETLADGSLRVCLASPARGEWTVTLVSTGDEACIGERLGAVRGYLDEDVFLANYADGLSDLDLPAFLRGFTASGALAGLISVAPHSSLHLVDVGPDGLVRAVRPATDSGMRVNGGFFAFRRAALERLVPGEDLVDGLFPRLVRAGQLYGYAHSGFWACMDTAKDRHLLEQMNAQGDTPWKVWLRAAASPGTASRR